MCVWWLVRQAEVQDKCVNVKLMWAVVLGSCVEYLSAYIYVDKYLMVFHQINANLLVSDLSPKGQTCML